VVATWLWAGTHLGALPARPGSRGSPAVPPTGRRVRLSGATVYTFDDGRLRGHWQGVDRLSLVQQLRAR
jgi:hypothetical protein